MAASIDQILQTAKKRGFSQAEIQKAKHVTGFKGDASATGRTRLYLTEQLDEYIEVDDGNAIEIDLGDVDSSPHVAPH